MSSSVREEAAWTASAEGSRVLVGLTADETNAYFSLSHAEPGVSCQEARERLRSLWRKHLEAMETARASRQPDAAGEAAKGGSAMSGTDISMPTVHPEEMRAEVVLRAGQAASLNATARATPAGLVAAGLLVSSILLSTAVLVWAARRPR